MIRVKNERFSRFFPAVPAIFFVTKGAGCDGNGLFFGTECATPAATERSFGNKCGGRGGTGPNTGIGRGRKTTGSVKWGSETVVRSLASGELFLLQVPWRISPVASPLSSRPKLQKHKFKTKNSRYSKNKVLFTVPCAYAYGSQFLQGSFQEFTDG